jgi:hypothetical protein
MKRNKKVKKYTRCTMNSVNIVALIVLSFFAIMVYWSQDARCTELAQEIGKAEKEFKRLERDCQREVSSWEELKTPDNLQQAFIRHGLDMGQPNQEQVVHMGQKGLPKPGQMSVARIRARRSQADRIAGVDYQIRARKAVQPRAVAAKTNKRAAVRR